MWAEPDAAEDATNHAGLSWGQGQHEFNGSENEEDEDEAADNTDEDEAAEEEFQAGPAPSRGHGFNGSLRTAEDIASFVPVTLAGNDGGGGGGGGSGDGLKTILGAIHDARYAGGGGGGDGSATQQQNGGVRRRDKRAISMQVQPSEGGSRLVGDGWRPRRASAVNALGRTPPSYPSVPDYSGSGSNDFC
jgi:hypothetical protein